MSDFGQKLNENLKFTMLKCNTENLITLAMVFKSTKCITGDYVYKYDIEYILLMSQS